MGNIKIQEPPPNADLLERPQHDKNQFLRPEFLSLQNNLALCLLKQKKLNTARTALRLVLQTDPANQKALLRQLEAYETIGTVDNAIEELKKVRGCCGTANLSCLW